jgi:hypothetical protein
MRVESIHMLVETMRIRVVSTRSAARLQYRAARLLNAHDAVDSLGLCIHCNKVTQYTSCQNHT